MSDVKISIIIPVYNVESYIEQCLRSVFNQTYKYFECIIVDDRGTDRSIEIAQKLIKQNGDLSDYMIIPRVRNGGLSAARNTGLEVATGEYIYFLDSDDMLFPNSIESLVMLVNKYPSVDIVQGCINVQNGKNYFGSKGTQYAEYDNNTSRVRNNLINGLPATSWNKLIRFDLIRNNGIRFKEGLIHEDELFRWELHKYVNSLCYSEQITYWYRTDNQNSIMKSSNQLRSLRSSISIISTILPDIKSRAEIDFAIYNLKLRKAARLVSSQDKAIIAKEINNLRISMDMPLPLYAELIMWNLPHCMVKKTFVLGICAVIRKLLLLFYK